METIKVRNLVIGEGRPKICVPIVGKSREEILCAAGNLTETEAELAEWRADWYEEVSDFSKVLDTAGALRDILGDLPFLFTFRTTKEGGEKSLEAEEYIELNRAVIESGYIDLVDVELFTGDEAVAALAECAHACQVKVIVSSHDFRKTPSRETILGRMKRMLELGADIPKIAVMPQLKEDVLSLLAATLEMSEHYAKGPVITMSMSGAGVVSRLAGETFGSAVTYGAVGKQSAPGQVDATSLKKVLDVIHESLQNG
ncbi:MAG: type I 3-dehydroquinate dehydratase [Hungatella sp.]|nr:type I 3-dehydroquinate dehydratase [Hungatella sp.]